MSESAASARRSRQTVQVTQHRTHRLDPLARLAPGPRTYVLAALLGIPVGAIAAVYLLVLRWLKELVWDGNQPRLAEVLPLGVAMLVTTTVGGLVVGLVRARHDRDTPHDLDDILADVDEAAADADPVGMADPDAGAPRAEQADERKEADAGAGPAEPEDGSRGARAGHRPIHSARWIMRAVVLGIISLTAGASLGPEAPLLVLATGFGARIAALLRLSSKEGVVISSAAALSGLFGGPLGPAVLGIEGRPTTRAPRLLGPGIVAGLTGYEAMRLILPGDADLGYTLPNDATDGLATLGWGVLGGALAAAAAALLLVSIAPTRSIAGRLPAVPRAVIGGFVLGLCGLAQPLVLFSGEHHAQDLIDGLATWTVEALLVILALKIVATATSLATGYFGGQIFPGAFVGMAAAALVVAVVPSAPGSVLVAAGAGAGTTVLLRRPFASALIMLFFFPLSSAISLIVGAAMGAAVVSVLRNRLPAPAIGAH